MCSFFRSEGLVFDVLRPCVRELAQMTSPPLVLLCSGLRANETFYLWVSSIISMRDHYASPIRKGYIYKYACICIFITVILSNFPTLSMDSPSMCRLDSFSHMLCSGSDAEFHQCLPVVLRVHILSAYLHIYWSQSIYWTRRSRLLLGIQFFMLYLSYIVSCMIVWFI